ncbi:MAG TPA: DUF2935 domain-containing protein [Symbiobacteriaceae bacterium]|nr:DUF2935 domain-containing protein [Symbiobacteriaceae bacterium]
MADGQALVAQALRENWFWASVFRDHAAFIFDNTAPDQDDVFRWARSFRDQFEKLLQQAMSEAQAVGITGPAGSYAVAGRPPEPPLASLEGRGLLDLEGQAGQTTKQLLENLTGLKRFKEELIQRKLDCKVKLGLGPTLLQHMVNELEEAQRTLGRVGALAQLPPPMQALHHHLVWLPDAAGHAGVIHSGLDAPEAKLLEASQDFKEIFNGMHLKALELYTMLKVAPRMVGALRRLNRDSMAHIGLFRAFLTELREHLEDCEILTTNLAPALADHMLREELYYTEKIMLLE